MLSSSALVKVVHESQTSWICPKNRTLVFFFFFGLKDVSLKETKEL